MPLCVPLEPKRSELLLFMLLDIFDLLEDLLFDRPEGALARVPLTFLKCCILFFVLIFSI